MIYHLTLTFFFQSKCVSVHLVFVAICWRFFKLYFFLELYLHKRTHILLHYNPLLLIFILVIESTFREQSHQFVAWCIHAIVFLLFLFLKFLTFFSLWSYFLLSFSFTLWSAGRQSSLFGWFSFLLTIIRSGRLTEIRLSVRISKSQRILCVSFSWTDSELWIYHLFEWSDFNL